MERAESFVTPAEASAVLKGGTAKLKRRHYSKNPHTRTCGLRTPRLKFGKKGAYI